MKSILSLRFWIALSLGVVIAAAVYHWPASPRTVVRHDLTCWHLAFSPDGTQLAVLDREAGLNMPGQILVWDVATGTVVHRLDLGIRPYPSKVVFAPDGKHLGLVDAGVVTKWDLATGRVVGQYDYSGWSHDPDRYPGREILFSPQGRWLMHDVHAGCVYDVESGQVVHDYHKRLPDRNLHVHGGCVAALVDGEVRTFDAVTGAQVGAFPTATKIVPMARTGYTFSADGTHGVYFSDTGQWVVRDSAAGRERVWGGDFDGFGGFSLSADNRFLAVAASDPSGGPWSLVRMRVFTAPWQIHVFDTTTGREVAPRVGAGFMSCFSPDGTILAVADRSGSIALWDWPPTSRWPRMVATALPSMLAAYGIGWWWSRRRRLGLNANAGLRRS